MLMRKLSVLAGILLFVILAFFASLKIQVRERGTDQTIAELPYGMRGVYLVGMSDLVIAGENELNGVNVCRAVSHPAKVSGNSMAMPQFHVLSFGE